jgi:hypothetical protein
MLLVHSNIKLLLNLYALQGGSLTPDCHLASRFIKWLSLPGIPQFAALFWVAHFAQIGGSLWCRLVAHFGADYSPIKKSRTLFAYYSKHAGKDSKKAIVKVARKLALIARGVVLKQQLYQEDYLQKKKAEQSLQKKTSNRRFSSGITEQHINKQPGNVLTSWPG